MNISEPFIRKPVATTLLVAAIALAGAAAYRLLPVSPLPQVEFPTISVNAGLPGASPETMASAVATPLERQFGRIAAVSEMSLNISAATGEQSSNAKQVSRAVESVNETTQAAASSAEELSTSTQELSAMAQKLQRLVGQFKIAGREAAPGYSISPRSSA